MIWKTPTGAFAALSPPAWLKQDMTRAAGLLPGVTVFVAFLDDLPHWPRLARQRELDHKFYPDAETYVQALHRHVPEARAELMPKRADRLAHLCGKAFAACAELQHLAPQVADKIHAGAQLSSAPAQRMALHPLLECEQEWLCHRGAPQAALVLLEPRAQTAAQDFTAALGAASTFCQLSGKPNAHRVQFWHEVGHIRAACGPQAWQPRREEELSCDRLAVQECLRAQDSASAQYVQDRRLLGALQTSPALHAYWYPLTLGSPSPVDPVQETLALVEVKSRAAGASAYAPQELLEAYDPERNIPVGWRLKGLQQALKQDVFSHPHARSIAGKMLDAAARTMPQLLQRGVVLSGPI